VIASQDHLRINFLKACLSKLGLRVNQDQNAVPSLSRLHLSSSRPGNALEIMKRLEDIVTVEEGENYIKDENDTFHLENPSSWSKSGQGTITSDSSKEVADPSADAEDRILDYSTVIKRLVVHEGELPSMKETPYFNHHAYFANLDYYNNKNSNNKNSNADPRFGKNLLYGEVVTSTNTMLEK
jgi:biotin---protein ligase